jgi:hypothetical protein
MAISDWLVILFGVVVAAVGLALHWLAHTIEMDELNRSIQWERMWHERVMDE